MSRREGYYLISKALLSIYIPLPEGGKLSKIFTRPPPKEDTAVVAIV